MEIAVGKTMRSQESDDPDKVMSTLDKEWRE
jgi:hypothetical protein